MKFKPLSEEEAAAQSADLWPNGTYDYEVHEAIEKDSSTGNEMTELDIFIYDQDGRRRGVKDYLVNTEKSAWKIRMFAASCGLLEQYKSGSLMANEMVGRTGKCEITTEPAKDAFPAKNKVKNYLKAASSASEPPPERTPGSSRIRSNTVKAPAGDIDDEIPF